MGKRPGAGPTETRSSRNWWLIALFGAVAIAGVVAWRALAPTPGAATGTPELSSAKAGRLAGITLEGEPGIGKTRLLLAAQGAAWGAGDAPVRFFLSFRLNKGTSHG